MKNLVVVLVINYNQHEYTLSCINSILASDYKNFKVILIDNGSDDEDVGELLKNLPKNKDLMFKRINPNIGMVGAFNYGFEEGVKLDPKYFMVINNDAIIDKSGIKELVNTCKECDNKAVVTGKVYHYDEPDILQFVGYKCVNKNYLSHIGLGMDEPDNGQYDKVEERDLIDDIFGLYPAELYKNIGAYSPYFWLNSCQADLALRAKNAGYKLMFTPKAKLWHKGSVSIGGRGMNPKLAYMTIQGSLILRYLHLKKIYFLIYYVKATINVLRTLVKSVYLYLFKRRNIFEYAIAKYKGWTYFNKWVFLKNEHTGI
jgi:GT2 family glycosyltransferase